MNRSIPIPGDAELRFFGKITASFNHDVRNALATINENAGLLMDYSAMVSRERPLDPNKVSTLAKRIADQVKRADGLIKSMSLFSHSVDESLKTLDLNESLQLLAAVSGRFASMKQVTLHVQRSENPVEIRTSPFLMLYILFICLEFAIQTAGKNQTVELMPQISKLGKSVRFGPLSELAQMPPETWPSVRISDLLPFLKTSFIVDIKAENIVLVFSET